MERSDHSRVLSGVRQRSESTTKNEAPGYVPSHYYANVAAGEIVNGVCCGDLENLSFDDESFDLHLTQDVFSTCLNPAAAFREIARTLRPGGAHVFTTPLVRKNEPTRFCARLAPDGTIAHLIEPREYHRNPMSSEGSLVTVNWGYDIANYVFKACGLFTNLVFIYNIELDIRVEHIEAGAVCHRLHAFLHVKVLVTYKPLVP